MERTCLYEGEDQLNEYFRDTLKDRTPSKPLLAQDQPKETQDMLESEILNIRHNAARTADRTNSSRFILGFTERDSRGFHNSGPDMKNMLIRVNLEENIKLIILIMLLIGQSQKALDLK